MNKRIGKSCLPKHEVSHAKFPSVCSWDQIEYKKVFFDDIAFGLVHVAAKKLEEAKSEVLVEF